MISIGSFLTTPNVLPKTRRFVFLRRNWSDPWTYVPWLSPIALREEAAPGLGRATLSYDFGRIKREHATTFSSWTPVDLRDWYVQIRASRLAQVPQVLFTGLVADDETQIDAISSATGQQIITAFGLGYTLSRQRINAARALESGAVQTLGWSPPFNGRGARGGPITGNRSGTSPDGDGVFVFADRSEAAASTWSALDVCRYLVKYFAPSGLVFRLAGQTNLLGARRVWDLEGMSVWDALKELVDRRQGAGLTLRLAPDGSILLWIFSVSPRPFAVGSTVLPANAEPVVFRTPTSHPHTHLVDRLSFRTTSLNTFDRIEIRGERMLLTGTFSYSDNTLEEGWTDQEELIYFSGAGVNGTEEDHDQVRSSDRFEAIYSRHVVPTNWDWTVGDAEGGTRQNLAPKANDDGTVNTGLRGGVWGRAKQFRRQTVLKEGIDYSVLPASDANPSGAEPDFRPMLVAIQDDGTGFSHRPDNRWHLLDNLAADYDPADRMRNVAARPLDGELGLQLSPHPRHYLADGAVHDYINGSRPTQPGNEPELDYRKLLVTATVESDERLRIVLASVAPHETQRTLTIDVPEAHYWYVAPGTVVDVKKGALVHLASGGSVLRDDRDRLEAVAALVVAWYGLRRQAISLPIKAIGRWVELGAMLVGIDSVWGREPIGTPVTARAVDFRTGRTTIETGWGGQDQAPLGLIF